MFSSLGYSEESALDKSKLMYKLLDRFAKDLETQLEGNGLEINVKTLKAPGSVLRVKSPKASQTQGVSFKDEE